MGFAYTFNSFFLDSFLVFFTVVLQLNIYSLFDFQSASNPILDSCDASFLLFLQLRSASSRFSSLFILFWYLLIRQFSNRCSHVFAGESTFLSEGKFLKRSRFLQGKYFFFVKVHSWRNYWSKFETSWMRFCWESTFLLWR